MLRFTELYYDDAERLALYISSRDNVPVEVMTCDPDLFPLPPKMMVMPPKVDAFKVGNYEIAYLDRRSDSGDDKKYKNRTLHRVMLGDELRKVMRKKGVDADYLEEKTGIRSRNIENIILGRHDASIDILGNIADALGCKVSFV